jgi:methylmalonyl-CoA mutase N-terminal domain/subunit
MTLSRAAYAEWVGRHLHDRPAVARRSTASGLPVQPVYTPLDVHAASEAELDWHDQQLGLPGSAPFTRGIRPLMYRERPWVMGMYSGRASPQQTNQRIRSLLAAGQTGFSVALDLPTQLGLDSDDPRSRGEVGRVGVPIDSLLDMVVLLDGVPLDEVRQIRTTANSIGPIAVALFHAAAEELGYSPNSFKVMLQNDVLKEYISRHTHIFPVAKGRDFSVDVIEYCAQHLPHWEPIEFCGYHVRDSGSTAVQEVAIAIANGIAYLEVARQRGIEIDAVGHSLYMFLSAGLDIFEEVAKFRATRRIWSELMERRFGAKTEAARALNIFCYTLGSAQTANEPLNNIVRIAYQALGAALGGVQTLATSSFDEAVGLPTPEAAHLGLRTQQILAMETGISSCADPLGGSYFVEALTNDLESAIRAYLDRIEAQGGAVAAIESGFLEREIEEEAFRLRRRVDQGDNPVVAVNCYNAAPTRLLHYATETSTTQEYDDLEAAQVAAVRTVRATRNPAEYDEAIRAVRAAAADSVNTIPSIIKAVHAHATIGEIVTTLADVWGRHQSNDR